MNQTIFGAEEGFHVGSFSGRKRCSQNHPKEYSSEGRMAAPLARFSIMERSFFSASHFLSSDFVPSTCDLWTRFSLPVVDPRNWTRS
jgi:hypothetical protein